MHTRSSMLTTAAMPPTVMTHVAAAGDLDERATSDQAMTVQAHFGETNALDPAHLPGG